MHNSLALAGHAADLILVLAVQRMYVFLLVRSSWLRVSVMRDLAQPIAPSALSAFRAVGRGGASRRLRRRPGAVLDGVVPRF